MPSIDVAAEIAIAADPADIASVMFDPARAPDWMSAVSSVEILDPALVRGARVRHRGKILDRDVAWTTEVDAVHFPHVLAVRVADGPLVGITRFEIQRSGDGSRVRIRAAGEPGDALARVPAALISGPLKTAMAGDLARLKAIVEA